MIAFCATESQKLWKLDNGCSKHMTGDPRKFIALKYNKGKVTFGDSLSSKIINKGTIVVNSRIEVENFLLVENLNPNILSVTQTCNQGHICIFNSEKCEIKNKESGKVIRIAIRNTNNVYILENENQCYLSMVDESWLWNKSLGHLGFENISKIRM